MKRTAFVVLVLLSLGAPLTADDLQIEIDPALTSISFHLKAKMHSVHGRAALSAGSLRLNTESGAMTGAVTIDAATTETGNNKRDKKMHGEVLLTADHPEIVLRVRRLEGELARQGASEVTLQAEIEILGHSHAIGIPSRIEINGDHFTAAFEFDIPYVEWGLDDPSTFVLRVAKVVQVKVSAEGAVGAADLPK
jgi:polyisoprenoid-binding protein YceI